jgi:hypothetical protein
MFSGRGTAAAYGLERLDESFLEVLIGWMTMSRPERRRFYIPHDGELVTWANVFSVTYVRTHSA